MNKSTDLRIRLLRALVELARELPPSTLNALITALESGGGSKDFVRFAATPTMREKLRTLEELCGVQPEVDTFAIAFALRATAEAVSAIGSEHRAEIAWTGPSTETVPLRRVDQVIYDIVGNAKEEVLLVTYAAYKAERALKALRDAADRGVRVRLIIELAHESGGKITFDGFQAFRTAVPSAQIFYWPMDRRKRSASGAYGAMHAKCLVADRSRAIVTSANFTEHALEANMELGIVVGQSIAERLAEHFGQLVVRGELLEST